MILQFITLHQAKINIFELFLGHFFNMATTLEKKIYHNSSILLLLYFLAGCSHYRTPDPMRPAHLATVLRSDSLCRSIEHSRHASELLAASINKGITKSPTYMHDHNLPPGTYNRPSVTANVQKEKRCKLVVTFKNEDIKVQYSLQKVAHTNENGSLTYSYPETILFHDDFMKKYGYDHAVMEPDQQAGAPDRPTSENGDRISLWIRQHMVYPPEARQAGIEGYTAVKFWLSRQGDIRSLRFIKSSGNILLDNATMNMFMGKKIPVDPRQKIPSPLNIKINYYLAPSH
ncbi:energy transducer TonB [Komagataeibacter sucrofermentans]|uniref:energy transducer TonB n=1 Tax=Komagataeibacter sucrofermentans TaxID=1053551 RepID=UPI00142E8BE2|nr:energy transducer TonB [Komagataeibacter sucrofermentans]